MVAKHLPRVQPRTVQSLAARERVHDLSSGQLWKHDGAGQAELYRSVLGRFLWCALFVVVCVCSCVNAVCRRWRLRITDMLGALFWRCVCVCLSTVLFCFSLRSSHCLLVRRLLWQHWRPDNANLYWTVHCGILVSNSAVLSVLCVPESVFSYSHCWFVQVFTRLDQPHSESMSRGRCSVFCIFVRLPFARYHILVLILQTGNVWHRGSVHGSVLRTMCVSVCVLLCVLCSVFCSLFLSHFFLALGSANYYCPAGSTSPTQNPCTHCLRCLFLRLISFAFISFFHFLLLVSICS